MKKQVVIKKMKEMLLETKTIHPSDIDKRVEEDYEIIEKAAQLLSFYGPLPTIKKDFISALYPDKTTSTKFQLEKMAMETASEKIDQYNKERIEKTESRENRTKIEPVAKGNKGCMFDF
jgi:hypothetical protein